MTRGWRVEYRYLNGGRSLVPATLPLSSIAVTLKEKVENKGLLYIPDISGFTRFVNKTEIEHSRLIIQELLELLINTNQIGLEVSEIEGDAILFYKFGESPGLEKIYGQVEKMFREFHRHLGVYDIRRYCQCEACTLAIDLTLKVITHYGEFTDFTVKNFSKLIGKDVIVAHQLLKNDISQHEYWLVTRELMPDETPANLTKWMKWDKSVKQTENGEISFDYTQLGELKKEISEEPPLPPVIPDKIKTISLSHEYETDIIRLFHASGDFRYRPRWQEEVRSVEEVNHFLPRVGTRYHCMLENGESIVYFGSSFSFDKKRIVFGNTDEKHNRTLLFTLETITDNKTRLTLDLYLPRNLTGRAIFNLLKKKAVKEKMERSLVALEKLVKEIKLPDET